MTVDIQQATERPAASGSLNGVLPRRQPATDDPAPLTCPACGSENASDAVFCSNAVCHKALGELKYVLEELKQETRWHETLAEKATGFIGKPHFVVVHALWFVLWALLNSGLFTFIRRFDEYPYVLLGIILAAEAIFISGFVLISSNRQMAHANKRAELDYEVNVQNYRHITGIEATLRRIVERLDELDAAASDGKRL